MKVLVDMLNIIFIEYHVARRKLHDEGKVLDEENLPFYAHLLFNKMNSIFQTYGELEICWEGKKSLDFRRSIYPEYKRNREKNKTEDEYQILKSFIPKIEEVLNYYPCRQYKIENAEGDDLMYSLCKTFVEDYDEKVIVLSTDGDLVQFQNFWEDKVSVYNPIKRSFATTKPNILLEKAIVGDSSDNIPGLFRVGIKTLEKMLDDKNKYNEIINKGNNKELFTMFTKIVDLRKAPENILIEIKELVKKPYNVFQDGEIELFFWESKLQDNIKRWMFVKDEIWQKIKQKQVYKEIETDIILDETKIISKIEVDEIDKILREYV